MTNIDQQSHQGTRRETYLMGMLIVVGLVFFHSAQIFSGSDFYVVNTQQSELTTLAANLFLGFANMWGMPLMMFIAGSAIWFSLRKRTLGQFLLNRVQRLLIPFITGIVLIFPPQVWIGINFHLPSYEADYWQFLCQFFNIRFSLEAFPAFIVGAPPNTLWSSGYLWFLNFLFVYTILLLPIFWNLHQESDHHLVSRCVSFLSRPWMIFLLALPIGLIEAFLKTDGTGIWNRFVWPFFLFYGFLLAYDRRFGWAIQRHRRSALLLGIVSFITYFICTGYLIAVLEADPLTNFSPVGLLARLFIGLGSWFWIIAIIGCAGNFSKNRARKEQVSSLQSSNPGSPPLDAPSGLCMSDKLADYGKEAQLPFYVLHQLPIILIGYFVVQWQVNAFVKYVVIVLGAIVATLLICDIAVRRTLATRILFGLKLKKTE
jgi:glucan biosynthesis protein C